MQFMRQLEDDSKFLEIHKVMDYSLLVGIHKLTKNESIIDDGILSSFDDEIYYFGIIDFIQKMEYSKTIRILNKINIIFRNYICCKA